MPMRWSRPAEWLWMVWLPFAFASVWSVACWAEPGDLVIGLEANVSHLDPHYSAAASDMNVYVNLYDTLVSRDDELNLVPALALSWTPIDAATWQFKLRQGVIFHNGDPLTAEDVKFSLERAAADHPRTSVYGMLSVIEQVEILNPWTVNIITKYPDGLLPARLSTCGAMVLPKHYFETVGMHGFRHAPIGTGAMQFVEWTSDKGLVFAANRRYWRGSILYDRVIYKSYPPAAARLAALLAGDVDFITAVPPDQVDLLERSDTTTVERALYAGFSVFYINVTKPPLDNKLIRQAMHHAINRQAIVDTLWHGRGAVPSDVYPTSFQMGESQRPSRFAYAPQTARALLTEAGYSGEEIMLASSAGELVNDQKLTETVAMMLRHVGFNAQTQFSAYATRLQQLRHKAMPGLLLGDLTSPLADPGEMFWQWLQPGGLIDYWRHPQWDQLMEQVRHLHDRQARTAMYRHAAEILLDEVPVLIILQPEKSFGLKKGLHWKARGGGVVVVDAIKPRP
jgi:peptide/nickel transport system substrate-binding protein